MRATTPTIRWATLTVAWLLAGVTASAATVEGLRWSSADGASSKTLRLEIAGGPADLDVRERADGVVILADGVSADLTAPAGVVVSPAEGSGRAKILVTPPGTRLLGVHVDGSGADVVVRAPGPEGIEGYRLGPGDVVNIAVYEDKSLTGEYTIGQDGAINLPLAGAVPAAGIAESELGSRIRAALSAYLDDPSVSVTIVAFQSQSMYVNVIGDSPRATKVSLRPGMRLSDALAEAGVALLPGQRVELLQSANAGGRSRVVLTSAEIDAADAPPPRDRDVINVLEPDFVFIRGEVRTSGRWTFRPGLTLQQLIALAGGLSDWASRKDVRVHRETDDGPVDLDVNLRRIEEGRDPDVELAPGDLVLVRRRVL